MNTDNLYDNLDVDGNKFKPTAPGEFIEITISKIERQETSLYKKTPGEPPRVGLIYYGTDTDGLEHEWSAWSAGAKRAVLQDKPEAGDFVRIEFTGETPVPGLSPKKNWDVRVLRRKGEVELDDQGLPVGF